MERHRFLLELWLEPREVAARILRLRGRIRLLPTGERPESAPGELATRSVTSLEDVDAFIHESFDAATPARVAWEAEP